MRLNKIIFVVFLVLYFIAGLSLLITGSVAHHHAAQFADLTGHSLMSGAGFVIALGVIIIILSALGFIGAYKNRLNLLQIFIVTLCLILLLQLIAAIVGFTLRNKANDELRKKLLGSLPLYYKGGNNDIREEWDRLQRKWTCCGVDNSSDWVDQTPSDRPPSSCCVQDCPTQSSDTVYYVRGCYALVRDFFVKHSKALGGVSIFFFFVEIVGLGSAIILLRDLKKNYGSV